MEPIDLSFLEVGGARIKGEIYASVEPDFLLQDLLEIELPNGEIIDVGWFPEHDPSGCYRITKYDYSTLHRLVRYSAFDVGQTLAIVHAMISDAWLVTPSASSESELNDLQYA